ncbi:TPA: hypothetical protein ACGJ7L_006477 [Pseudomonas aeruginosa]|uniref:Uncharacterized protein n=2 Tax=Pseudomonas aeruginosa TaxID=287 RepID=A0A9P1R404_PSEAI|nr:MULTISPECIES: hypothetical protein [Pseudomonas]CDI94985.1 hypothetical protein BN889_06985 [Pseudomonas aeruginosa PA38182]ARG50668.1 hypothetical protein BFV99_15460 [Pseudomonas aeruginosa]AYW60734.1 hypothetical protein EGV93_17825 [Pseudomonas aeruginosa]EIU2683177.1 hypothetical protein [Pseudomonas aeruginosa]EJA3279025.1 hypothetical protein [Pseudomonas aeruginosa]
MSKHTPGPWEIARSPHGITIFEIGPCKPDEYAGAVWLSVSEADARLIAAAPELLEACQAFKRLYGRLWDVVEPSGSGFLSPESVKEYDAIHELMTAAIAKATA